MPQSLAGERVNLLEGHLEQWTNPSEMVNHQANAEGETDCFRDPFTADSHLDLDRRSIQCSRKPSGTARRVEIEVGLYFGSNKHFSSKHIRKKSCSINPERTSNLGRAVPKPQSLAGERVNLLEIAGHLTNPVRTGLKSLL